MLLQALVFLAVPFALAYAGASDLVTMTIPNRLQLLLAGAFPLAAAATGLDLATVGLHLLAAAIVLGLTFGCFAAGWMGGGDAKLCAAVALWLGLGTALMDFLLLAAVYGGALTLGLLWLRGRPMPALVTGQPWAARLLAERGGIPYGIALAAAALGVWPHTAWVQAALAG